MPRRRSPADAAHIDVLAQSSCWRRKNFCRDLLCADKDNSLPWCRLLRDKTCRGRSPSRAEEAGGGRGRGGCRAVPAGSCACWIRLVACTDLSKNEPALRFCACFAVFCILWHFFGGQICILTTFSRISKERSKKQPSKPISQRKNQSLHTRTVAPSDPYIACSF